MQTVHVLRTEKQSAATGLFAPLGQSNMRRIGFSIAGACATFRVILPNQRWVFLPSLNVRQFVMAVATPLGSLKDRDSALRANSSPGEDEDSAARLHANLSASGQTGL